MKGSDGEKGSRGKDGKTLSAQELLTVCVITLRLDTLIYCMLCAKW